MNGWAYLMNMKVEEIANVLGVSLRRGNEIKIMTPSELSRCEDLCPETAKINFNYKAKCRLNEICCNDCRREFLENEIQDWSEDSDS